MWSSHWNQCKPPQIPALSLAGYRLLGKLLIFMCFSILFCKMGRFTISTENNFAKIQWGNKGEVPRTVSGTYKAFSKCMVVLTTANTRAMHPPEGPTILYDQQLVLTPEEFTETCKGCLIPLDSPLNLLQIHIQRRTETCLVLPVLQFFFSSCKIPAQKEATVQKSRPTLA